MTKNVAANSSTSSLLEGGRVPGVFVVIGFAVAVVVVAIGRLALFGWAGIAPDDARYVFVGLSTLDGHGPITPSGNLFLLRSPIYGIALAAGRALTVDGPIAGARIVAVVLTVAALLAAVRFGWSLGGPVGAAGTALALMAMPGQRRRISTRWAAREVEPGNRRRRRKVEGDVHQSRPDGGRFDAVDPCPLVARLD
jgi:hypothetical protein